MMNVPRTIRMLALAAFVAALTGAQVGCHLFETPSAVDPRGEGRPGVSAAPAGRAQAADDTSQPPADTAGSPSAAGTSLKDEMRMPWSRQAGGYVRRWLVCGVFPSPAQKGKTGVRTAGVRVGGGYDTDYLAGMGGEAAARPAEGMQVSRPDGTSATWRSYTSQKDDLDFQRQLRAVGRSVEAGLKFFDVLQETEVFREPFLESISESDDGVDFEYTVGYVPAPRGEEGAS